MAVREKMLHEFGMKVSSVREPVVIVFIMQSGMYVYTHHYRHHDSSLSSSSLMSLSSFHSHCQHGHHHCHCSHSHHCHHPHQVNEKGQVIAQSQVMKDLEKTVKIEDEKGLTCCICREGYENEPKKVRLPYYRNCRARCMYVRMCVCPEL